MGIGARQGEPSLGTCMRDKRTKNYEYGRAIAIFEALSNQNERLRTPPEAGARSENVRRSLTRLQRRFGARLAKLQEGEG